MLGKRNAHRLGSLVPQARAALDVSEQKGDGAGRPVKFGGTGVRVGADLTALPVAISGWPIERSAGERFRVGRWLHRQHKPIAATRNGRDRLHSDQFPQCTDVYVEVVLLD